MTFGVKGNGAEIGWMDCRLLLGSKSPRRRELLGQLGLPCRIVDIEVEETVDHAVEASKVAETLSRKKAEGYRGELAANEVLVTADTVVVHEDVVLGKPHSHEEALEMLRALSGKVHQVYTGVTLRGISNRVSFTEKTDVAFRTLTEREMSFYVDVYKPYDKAGAYGIQEWIGMVGIERIEGCFYNVMGLPVARLYKELEFLVNGHGTLVHEGAEQLA